MNQYPKQFIIDCVDALIAAAAPLDGAKVMLFQNDIQPDGDTVLADLDAADFTGYALSSAVVWGETYIDDDGLVKVSGGSKQFNQTAATVSNTIYGWALVDGAGADLLIAKRFDDPIVMDGPDQAIIVVPTFQVPCQA